MKHNKKGLFIVIEGTDGSGKTVQFNLLLKRLKKTGYQCQTVDFPQHGKPSAYFVDRYLTGHYGGWRDVGPYKASLFYGLDRYEVGSTIRQAIKNGKIVLGNRYIASNLGHQGAKIKNERERIKFFHWVYDTEYRILGIPRPDINIFLSVPAKISYQLIARKTQRRYLKNKKRDIHEKDLNHLKLAEKSYLTAIKLFPRDFKLVECVVNGKLLTVKEIASKIWVIVQKYLWYAQ